MRLLSLCLVITYARTYTHAYGINKTTQDRKAHSERYERHPLALCAHLSIFPHEKVAQTMQLIEENTHRFRGELGALERHQLRIIPEVIFHLDETIDRMERIDQLLAEGK